MRQYLIDFYLEWVNAYLTTEKMAEDKDLTENMCVALIEMGRDLHEDEIERNR